MTELLAPRYKVIADYPGSPFKINEVIPPELILGNGLDRFPVIFKKLEWWQERDVSQMPRYLKDKDGKIGMFEQTYDGNLRGSVMVTFENGDATVRNINDFAPATETEYLNYIKSKP